jgi:hypothetical protein
VAARTQLVALAIVALLSGCAAKTPVSRTGPTVASTPTTTTTTPQPTVTSPLSTTTSPQPTTTTHVAPTVTTDPSNQSALFFSETSHQFAIGYLFAGRCDPNSNAAVGDCRTAFTVIRTTTAGHQGSFIEIDYQLCTQEPGGISFTGFEGGICSTQYVTGTMKVLAFKTPGLERAAVAAGSAPGSGEVAGWSFGEWLFEIDTTSDAATVHNVIAGLNSVPNSGPHYQNMTYEWGPKPSS